MSVTWADIVAAVCVTPMPGGGYVPRRHIRSHVRYHDVVVARVCIVELSNRYLRDPTTGTLGLLMNRDPSSITHLRKLYTRQATSLAPVIAAIEGRLNISARRH